MIPPPAAGDAAASGWCILLVEDEPEVRELLATMLRSAGHEVVEATDGREGLAQLSGREFDAIVCGILMPHMDGMEFFERVQREHPAAAGRVLFMTDWADKAPVAAFLDQSGRPCLDKPVAQEALLRILQEIVTASTARASRRVSRSTLTPFTPDEADAIRATFKASKGKLMCPRCDTKLESGEPLGGGHSIATVWLLQCPSCMRSMILRDLHVNRG